MTARTTARFLILLLFAILLPVAAFAQASPPPTVDGTITANEYGDHTNGRNRYDTDDGQSWYSYYDATNLYVGITNANTAQAAILYLDTDPLTPAEGGVAGGTNADGNLVGFEYDQTRVNPLPFRADFVVFFKDGYNECRRATGTGTWGAAIAPCATNYASTGGNTREIVIPWSTINQPNGGAIPASYLFTGYLTSSDGFIYGEIPNENPGGDPNPGQTNDFDFDFFFAVRSTMANMSGARQTPFSLPNTIADLYLTFSDSPDPVIIGGTVTFRANLINRGPGTATNATLQVNPSSAFNGVTVTSVQSSTEDDSTAPAFNCTTTEGAVTCTTTDPFEPGDRLIVTVQASASTSTGNFNSIASATADEDDAFDDQSRTISTRIVGLQSVSVTPGFVTGGCGTANGTVTLTSPAPAGGATVTLSSNNSAASVSPSTVTIAVGQRTATFNVTTVAVSADTTATITATLQGANEVTQTATRTLTIRAPRLASLAISPSSVSGGTSATGTVTLNCIAPAGGITIALSSSNSAVASVPASVTVMGGETSATFTITTAPRSNTTSALITATQNGVTPAVVKRTRITVTPTT